MKKYDRLKITEIRPEGWLLDQLKIQMKGLTGCLYEIWDSVGSYSGWLGGTGDGWERVPYYLDGLLVLSYYLQDKEHWELACRFVEWTLGSQDEEGNFGPASTKAEQWSKFQMLKVLVQYEEISGDGRVVPFVRRYLEYMAALSQKIRIRGWSQARIPELLYVGKWLYEKTQDDSILDLLRQIDKSSLDWCDFLAELPFTRPADYYINWEKYKNLANWEIDEMVPYHATHVVNVTMGFKHPALRAWLSGDRKLEETAKKGIGDVIRKHGVVSGCINGDEHLAGNDPGRGSELCSVAEYMFSLQPLLEIFGDFSYADQLERLAYNALPATITEDFMGHQYLQQANQIRVDDTPRPWFNNSRESTIFGLEPNFGCCTANMHQAWPKLVNTLWLKEKDDTLVSAVFAPGTVSGILRGERVSVTLLTEYPFRDRLIYRFGEAASGRITLKIRIPQWCDAPQIQCEGAEIEWEKDAVSVTKKFQTGDEVAVRLPMEVKTSLWYHDSLAVERGPLVYALDMKERWEVYREVAGVKDYCIHPESSWNYAINRSLKAEAEEGAVTGIPFAKAAPPVSVTVAAKKLDTWKEEGGNTGDLPVSPIETGPETEDGREVRIRLIPFGCTKLRISEFPYYDCK